MNPVKIRLTNTFLLLLASTMLLPTSATAQRRYGKSPPRYRAISDSQRSAPRGRPTKRVQYEDELFDVPSPSGSDVIPEVLDEVVPEYADPGYESGIDPVADSMVSDGYMESTPSVEMPTPAYEDSPAPLSDEVISSTGPINEVFSPLEPIVDGSVDDGYLLNYDANFSGDAPAPIYSTGSWFGRGDWYTEITGVFLDRNKTRGRTANGGVQAILNDGAQIFRFNNLVRHNYETGARIILGHQLGRDAARRDHGIEFGFLGGFDWEAQRTVIAPTDGNINTTLTRDDDTDPLAFPFFDAKEQTLKYDADFTSLEANYRIRSRPGRDQLAMQPDGRWVRHGVGSRLISFLGGFRYVGFNETVDYSSVRVINNATDGGIGRLLTRTNNDMIGFQLGFDVTEKYDTFTWGLGGKFGGMMNFADRRSLIDNQSIDIDDVRTRAGQQRKDTDETLSFVADFGLHGTYQIRPNLHLKARYDFMFLTSQSLAPDNLEFLSGFSTMNTGGTVFLNGGSFGFEATW